MAWKLATYDIRSLQHIEHTRVYTTLLPKPRGRKELSLLPHGLGTRLTPSISPLGEVAWSSESMSPWPGNHGLYYEFTLIFSKPTREDVNYLNFGCTSYLSGPKEIWEWKCPLCYRYHCPPIFPGWRAGYGLQQYNYCIFEPQHTQINVGTETFSYLSSRWVS